MNNDMSTPFKDRLNKIKVVKLLQPNSLLDCSHLPKYLSGAPLV